MIGLAFKKRKKFKYYETEQTGDIFTTRKIISKLNNVEKKDKTLHLELNRSCNGPRNKAD